MAWRVAWLCHSLLSSAQCEQRRKEDTCIEWSTYDACVCIVWLRKALSAKVLSRIAERSDVAFLRMEPPEKQFVPGGAKRPHGIGECSQRCWVLPAALFSKVHRHSRTGKDSARLMPVIVVVVGEWATYLELRKDW
ncbi:hypothetical protein F5Y18DRAFT_428696 [Xylariaceae sp. FL1019]|nr:hypothetical protein F5Y18DRAFT_428696 [Xylariaceae sp. FL1019]